MALETVNTATLSCTFGIAPSMLMVLPINRVMAGYQPSANIMDHKPFVNIMTFGMCSSLANPTVAAATSAAMGVLTPMPCIPNTPTPWAPGSPTVLINNIPALNNTSKCMCMWGGCISIVSPGQATVNEP